LPCNKDSILRNEFRKTLGSTVVEPNLCSSHRSHLKAAQKPEADGVGRYLPAGRQPVSRCCTISSCRKRNFVQDCPGTGSAATCVVSGCTAPSSTAEGWSPPLGGRVPACLPLPLWRTLGFFSARRLFLLIHKRSCLTKGYTCGKTKDCILAQTLLCRKETSQRGAVCMYVSVLCASQQHKYNRATVSPHKE
jgi:hypothetical protein